MKIVYQPIGLIHTPFEETSGLPIQGALRPDVRGQIEIYPSYREGLKDIEGFSHLIVLYHFHKVEGYTLTAIPYLDKTTRGLFAIRGPGRPNPIGLTVVRLESCENGILNVSGVDMVNGTPLLDIKPYIPDIDSHPHAETGWVGKRFREEGRTKLSDRRFSGNKGAKGKDSRQ